MKAEHWQDDLGDMIFDENNPSREWMITNAKQCCIIEGKDWNDIMTKYHEHMGFEPYKPIEE